MAFLFSQIPLDIWFSIPIPFPYLSFQNGQIVSKHKLHLQMLCQQSNISKQSPKIVYLLQDKQLLFNYLLGKVQRIHISTHHDICTSFVSMSNLPKLKKLTICHNFFCNLVRLQKFLTFTLYLLQGNRSFKVA